MKFAISPKDKLALVLSLVPHTVQGAERQDIRLVAWDDLGVRAFARIASQRLQRRPVVFSDEELAPFALTPAEVVDLQATTVQFLIDEIAAGVPGEFTDQLAELRHELRRVQDKTYKLPKVE